VTGAVLAQMDNPKPIEKSHLQMDNPKPIEQNHLNKHNNRFYRYIELSNRATTPACNSETAVSAGTQLTIMQSASS
jgi:hypothetical protein